MMKKAVSIILIIGLIFIFGVFLEKDANAYSVSVDKTQLIQGECLTLTWSGFGSICNISVYKGNTFWTYANTQASYSGNMQICSFNDWELRNDYKIRVEEKSNPSIYVYSQLFSVVAPAPYLFDYQINGGASSTSSRNVSLQFNFTTATPTHYMASENSNFSGASWITYNGNNTVWLTLSDYEGMKFVFFKLKNNYGESNIRQDNISYIPMAYYNISGYVLDRNGKGVADVLIEGVSGINVMTNSNGYYIINNVPGNWTGTTSPKKNGYTFSPSSKTYSGVSGDMSNQNFTATSEYGWNIGSWGECCESCDGGRRSRLVQCIGTSNNNIVMDQYCTDTKPNEYDYNCPEQNPSHLDNEINGQMYTQ